MKKNNIFKKAFDQDQPYFIAEIGVNHEGSFKKALELIDLAKEGGAHAAKFQSYKAETIASKNSPSYWDTTKESTKSQFQLFKKYDSFNQKDYEKLKLHCDSIGIDFLSTPFDSYSADFLNDLVPFFKIASADLNNKLLIEQIDGFGKPMILSTGASYYYEIERTLNWIKKSKVTLLHCVLNYPTPNENANLSRIKELKKRFNNTIGYSDHTLPSENMDVLVASYLLGAKIIEKHFTDDKKLPGNDHYHSADKNDLMNFFKQVNFLNQILGNKNETQIIDEMISRKNARRSLYLTKELKKGETIEKSLLIPKRPGGGIGPEHYEDIVGKTLNIDLDTETAIQWNHLIY